MTEKEYFARLVMERLSAEYFDIMDDPKALKDFQDKHPNIMNDLRTFWKEEEDEYERQMINEEYAAAAGDYYVTL